MRIRAYQQANSDNNSLERDQGFFLMIARHLDLRIMIHLLIGPGQYYRDSLAHYALGQCNGKMTWEQFLAFLPDWKTVESEAKSALPGSPLSGFRAALLDWSFWWHLDADWCRDRAIGALRLWGWSKGAQRYFCWNTLDFWSCVQERLKIIDQLCEEEQEFLRSLVNDPGTFGIDVSLPKSKRRDGAMSKDEFIKLLNEMPRPKSTLLPRAFPSGQTLDQYLSMARKHLEENSSSSTLSEAMQRKMISKILDSAGRSYYRQIVRYLKSRGWQEVRSQPEHLKHLIWAARYQVFGVELSQIAAGPPLMPTESVSQAISRVLKHLGLRNRKRQSPTMNSPKVSNH